MADPLDYLYWRGEILQILYWLRGENLGESASPADLEPFLGIDEQQIQSYLDQLEVDGFIDRSEETRDRYFLTDLGVEEGGRQFADEFEELTRQGHGECNNPLCECKTLGPEYCLSNIPHQH
jgi:predicted transcriptional regulator